MTTYSSGSLPSSVLLIHFSKYCSDAGLCRLQARLRRRYPPMHGRDSLLHRVALFLHSNIEAVRKQVLRLCVCCVCSEGGFFQARLSFPKEYPNMPPVCRFTSEMWHPNGKMSYALGWSNTATSKHGSSHVLLCQLLHSRGKLCCWYMVCTAAWSAGVILSVQTEPAGMESNIFCMVHLCSNITSTGWLHADSKACTFHYTTKRVHFNRSLLCVLLWQHGCARLVSRLHVSSNCACIFFG